jgi:D-serine dehydratase
MKITYQSATIDPHGKGLGRVPSASVPLERAAHLEWNLLEEDVSLPAAVLYADRMEHNLRWMQAFVAEYGLKLAPHGKTTMAPQLFRRQLETGAWGITLATAHQTRAAYLGGVPRVLMANQLVGRHNMAIIAELLSDQDFEFFCLVDSVEGVEQLGTFFQVARKPLQVLLEFGVPGGRTGVRDDAQRDAVVAAIARYPGTLVLAASSFSKASLPTRQPCAHCCAAASKRLVRSPSEALSRACRRFSRVRARPGTTWSPRSSRRNRNPEPSKSCCGRAAI